MAKAKTNSKEASVVSLRALCEKAGVKHYKVYNSLKGIYQTLSITEKTKLANTFSDEVSPLLREFGFYMKIGRIKDPG